MCFLNPFVVCVLCLGKLGVCFLHLGYQYWITHPKLLLIKLPPRHNLFNFLRSCTFALERPTPINPTISQFWFNNVTLELGRAGEAGTSSTDFDSSRAFHQKQHTLVDRLLFNDPLKG